MRNLKKFLAVVVAVTILLTAMVPAFAAPSNKYEQEATVLNTLGLYDGVSTTSFNPDLGTALNRETGITMLVKVFAGKANVEALSASDITSTLSFKDASKISDWAKPYIAYAVKNGLVKGNDDGTFGAKDSLLGKAYSTLVLRILGYEPNYDTAAGELAAVNGLSAAEAVRLNSKPLIKDDLVGITFAALQAKAVSGSTVIEMLVAGNIVDLAKSIEAGVNPKAKAAAEATVAEKAAQTAADTAVKAYEAVAKADEAVKAAAVAAVAKVTDTTAKAALTARVSAQDAKLVDTATEAKAKEAAEVSVKAYETAAIDDLAKVAAAEKLGLEAVEAVKAVKITADNKAFSDRIAARKSIIDAKKEALTPATVTVNGSNLGNIVINFSKSVDAATVAHDVDGTAGNAVNPSPATVKLFLNGSSSNLITSGLQAALGSDNKSLTVKYNTTINQYDKIRVVVDGVKDTNKLAVAKFDETVSVVDRTDATVTNVALSSKNLYKSVVVTTDEPISVASAFSKTLDASGTTSIGVKIDGSTVFAKANSDILYNTTTIDLPTNLSEGTHTIDIWGAKDVAGFMLKPYSGSFQVGYDKVAPVATKGYVSDKKKVKIEFSENVDIVGAIFSVKEFGSTAERVTGSSVSGKVVSLNITTLTLTSLLSPVTITVQGVKDIAGNVMAEKQTFTGLLSDDTTAPYVSSAAHMLTAKEIADSNTFNLGWDPAGANGTHQWPASEKSIIRVPFNESNTVWLGSGTLPVLKLYKKGSTTPITTSITCYYSGYDTTYDFLVPYFDTLSAGEYTLTIENIKDYSLRGNLAGLLSVDFTTIDINAPTIVESYRIGTDKILVRFSEAMDTATLSAAGNYYLSVTGSAYTKNLADIQNAYIDSVTSNRVLLVVPNGNTVGNANYVTGISMVSGKDKGGINLSGAGFGIGNYYSAIAPNPSSLASTDFTVAAIAKNQVKVTLLNNHTFASADPGSFAFYQAGQAGAAAYLVDLGIASVQLSDDKTSATISLIGNNLSPLAKNAVTGSASNGLGVDLVIKSGTGTTDELGRDIGLAATLVADKIKAAQIVDSKDAAAGAVFTIDFDENLAYSSVLSTVDAAYRNSMMAVGVEVKDSKGNILTPNTDYTVIISASNKFKLVFTINKTGYTNETFYVQVTKPEFLVDENSSTGVVVRPFVVTNITK